MRCIDSGQDLFEMVRDVDIFWYLSPSESPVEGGFRHIPKQCGVRHHLAKKGDKHPTCVGWILLCLSRNPRFLIHLPSGYEKHRTWPICKIYRSNMIIYQEFTPWFSYFNDFSWLFSTSTLAAAQWSPWNRGWFMELDDSEMSRWCLETARQVGQRWAFWAWNPQNHGHLGEKPGKTRASIIFQAQNHGFFLG